MICKQCNTLNESGDKFCFKCGAPLMAEGSQEIIPAFIPNSNQSKANLKDLFEKHSKKIAIGVGLLLIIFVLIPMMGNLLSTGDYELKKDSILVTYNSDGDPSAVVSKGKVIELDEGNIKVNFSGNVAVYTSNYDDDGYDLAVITKGEEYDIDDEVLSYKISNDGEKIVYVKNSGEYNIGDLYSYDVSSKKSDKVDEDVYSRYIALSPNGKSIMYLGDVDEDDNINEDCTAYLSLNGGKPKEVRDNFIPVAISDKGKLQYGIEFDDYLDDDGEFVVYKGKKAIELDVDYNEISQIAFTSDMSEVMYSSDDETQISENAKEGVKVSNETNTSIVRPYGNMKIDYFGNHPFSIYVYGIKTFKDKVISSSGSLYYVDHKYDTHKIAKDTYVAIISNNNKELIVFDDNNNLERIDINKGKSKAKKIADDVYRIGASKDLKHIYFLDEDEDLYYINGNSEAKKVEKDVDDFVVYKNVVYIISDSNSDGGTLSVSKAGREAKEVKEADDEAYRFYVNGDDVYVALKQDDESTDLYSISTSGKIKIISKDLEL